ncbi:TPA: hypothetical protein ACWP5X_003292 [Escherichia coli]
MLVMESILTGTNYVRKPEKDCSLLLGGGVFDELIKSREKDLEDGVAKDLKKINETVQDNIQSSGNAIGIYAKTS